jgi:hypothetical protein
MKAKGLVDRDNEDPSEALMRAGIAKLRVYAVESIYFYPAVVTAVASVQGKETEVEALLIEACSKITDEQINRIAEDCAERALRSQFKAYPPKLSIAKEDGGIFKIELERLQAIESSCREEIVRVRDSANWEQLTKLIKVKSTQAPALIMERLGLTKGGYYEQARRAIATSDHLKSIMEGLVPNPFE